MNKCEHWACNLKNNTCIGCGYYHMSLYLQEPIDCKCMC